MTRSLKQTVAWMKELSPNLVPKSAVIMKITEVFIVKVQPTQGRRYCNTPGKFRRRKDSTNIFLRSLDSFF